jgi:hypothetical protein
LVKQSGPTAPVVAEGSTPITSRDAVKLRRARRAPNQTGVCADFLGWNNSTAPNPRLLYLLKYFLPGFTVFNPIKTFKEKLTGTSMTYKISQSRDELIRLVPVSYF